MERDILTKNLSRRSEELATIKLALHELYNAKRVLLKLRNYDQDNVKIIELVESLEAKATYIRLETNGLLEELGIASEMPKDRCFITTSELKDGCVVLHSTEKAQKVLFLSPYSDKNRTINIGDVAEIPQKENYIFERLKPALSKDSYLLILKEMVRKG